jgi:branched-chain amino acid aminotransferase
MAQPIPVTRTTSPRPKPRPDDLAFGRHFTDHLLRAEWDQGRGWHDLRIEPYGPLHLDPGTSALHYGQAIFEGLKAYPAPGGGLRLFRPRAHALRFASSARRLCMPPPDPAWLVEGLKALLRVDAGWMPAAPGTSLYVRPLLFATEPYLGVRASSSYALLVMCCPVGAYFSGPPRPLRIRVEQQLSRAAPGGIGAAKGAANYVASLSAAEAARAAGYDQVLWLDAAQHRAVEEIGTMNFFARLGGKVVTPSLETGTILPGITRDTVLALLREWGVPVEERRVEWDELVRAHGRGELLEAFGTGTASVVLPIGELASARETLTLPAPGPDAIGTRLREAIVAVQSGGVPDAHGWLEEVGA